MRTSLFVLALAAVLAASTGSPVAPVAAQPEDRQRSPTASTTVDPCTRFDLDRDERASGADPARSAQRSGTMIVSDRARRESAPAMRGPVAPTDPAYQQCLRRRDR